MEDRIERLENLAALQDDTIKEMNSVIYAQQKQIDLLEKKVGSLSAKLRQLVDIVGKDDIANDPPPHYGG